MSTHRALHRAKLTLVALEDCSKPHWAYCAVSRGPVCQVVTLYIVTSNKGNQAKTATLRAGPSYAHSLMLTVYLSLWPP